MSSKIIVLLVVAVAVAAVVGLWLYIDERGGQGKLAAIDCAGLLPTNFELQGRMTTIGPDTACAMLRTIAAMEPTDDRNGSDESDPWHYFGRIRIRPKDDAWFLVFMARRSEGFRPRFSLRHRRGSGWSVIGVFDAEPVLRQLGALERIDRARLESDSSLVPDDQSLPM